MLCLHVNFHSTAAFSSLYGYYPLFHASGSSPHQMPCFHVNFWAKTATTISFELWSATFFLYKDKRLKLPEEQLGHMYQYDILFSWFKPRFIYNWISSTDSVYTLGSSRKRGQFRGPIETLPGSDEQLLGTSAGTVMSHHWWHHFIHKFALCYIFPFPPLWWQAVKEHLVPAICVLLCWIVLRRIMLGRFERMSAFECISFTNTRLEAVR